MLEKLIIKYTKILRQVLINVATSSNFANVNNNGNANYNNASNANNYVRPRFQYLIFMNIRLRERNTCLSSDGKRLKK